MRPYYQTSEQMLGASSASRGLQGMVSPTPPGPQMMNSSGGMDKPGVNPQPFNNARLAAQDQQENIKSGIPQGAANAMGQQRSMLAAKSDQDSKAQMFAAERLSQALYANDAGTAMMRVGSEMSSPEAYKLRNHLASGNAMTQGMDPAIGQVMLEANMYG